MKDIIFDTFQNDVSTSLIRHKSILDVLTNILKAALKLIDLWQKLLLIVVALI